MSELTMETIKAAQDKDINAISDVLAATETRVTRLAQTAAGRMTRSGSRYNAHVEEFSQVGRIAAWEALGRFKGETVDSFYGFIHSTVEHALMDATRSERNPGAGVDKDAVKTFGNMLEMADGDVYLAEKLAQTVPPKGQRLSADRANAARLSWQGSVSMDAAPPNQHDYERGGARTDFLADVNRTVSTFGVPEDLVEPSDLNREASRVKHAVVHAILDSMGDQQRAVIEHSFGIRDAIDFGHGDGCDNEGMAEFLGIKVCNLRPARTKGMQSFAKRYIKVTARGEAHAAVLAEAAAANLTSGGRK
ncbi:sigma factor [Streptomyces sp. NPDC054950]